ncbi:MAG: glycosyltransferase family 2 protein [Myxococcales bacterium]|nr:glycosyltransferase family 2 protein [Myxococcales bacterium]MDD9965454.1 glycosyltransferase family 2 protein [Myxococcales bacterium]
MDLSVVVPVYNEEESLRPLLAELHEALGETQLEYEIVCIDDGSRDRSFAVLQELAASDKRLVVGRFRRNFGQTAAMQAGFDAARGAVVATLDADMQNDPRDIPRMLEKLAEGYDLVAGWRADRKDTFVNRRLPSIVANWLIGRTTQVRLHDNGCTLKLMRADLVKELRLYGEMHRFIPAMASLVGAEICELKVNHRSRQFGQSKYGIGRTVRVVLDLVTVLFLQSYLARPMQVFGLGGLITGFAGFLISGWLTVDKLVYGNPLANRPLLLLGVMLILVGVQLVSLGLVADVLGRTYHEAQRKPPYYVRTWLGRDQAGAGRPGWEAKAVRPVQSVSSSSSS